MRDDIAAPSIGAAEKEYSQQFFYRSHRDLEIFLQKLLSKGPVKISDLTIDSIVVSGSASFGGDVTVTGDLSVDGTSDFATATFTGLTCGSAITAANHFVSSTAISILAATGAGTCYMRPNGQSNPSGQMSVNPSGNMDVAGTITVAGSISTFGSPASITGANAGFTINGSGGFTQTSKAVTTAAVHHHFYNPNGLVGNINTTGSATAYATSSDEHLKNFIGPYDPLSAIEVIRADPVRDFYWKSDGSYAVGWGAQTSYNVSQDLAVPPAPRSPEEVAIEGTGTDPKEPGYIPWSMDQSKRAPYLWAALTWALDRIDELNARVTELENKATQP